MYPFLRLGLHMAGLRGAAPLAIGESHVSHHRVWPHDIDPWIELNNGRALTLFDIGRLGMFVRLGAVGVMRKNGWAGAIAGASTRYRHRIKAFEQLEMRSRIVGWDARFTYAEQSLWRGERCCVHALQRLALSDKAGLVPAPRMAEAMNLGASPPLPDWIAAWADADTQRPWPPT